MENENVNVIEVKNLKFVYNDGTVALENINFDIKKGQFIALIGQNGCGKTTLSKCLNGILKLTLGSIKVNGINVTKKGIIKDLVRNIGYVFQNPDHQLFNSKVYDEIAYALHNIGLADDEIDMRVKAAAQIAGVSEKIFDEQPCMLVKGLRQRVAIASILSLKPQVIIVDEPTTGQDHRQSIEIMKFLKKLNEQGHTIIIITHEMDIVAQYAQRILVMKKGAIYMDDTPREIFSQPEKLKEGFVKPPLVTRLAQLLDSSGNHNDVLNIEELKELL
jgi:energy-coupling factor transport system ATP-binding protein